MHVIVGQIYRRQVLADDVLSIPDTQRFLALLLRLVFLRLDFLLTPQLQLDRLSTGGGGRISRTMARNSRGMIGSDMISPLHYCRL